MCPSEIPSPPLPPTIGGRGSRTWLELKQQGNPLYKTGTVEPIDLYKANGTLIPFACNSIIKYAYRYLKIKRRDRIKTMNKIIHYAQLLIALEEEEHETKNSDKT